MQSVISLEVMMSFVFSLFCLSLPLLAAQPFPTSETTHGKPECETVNIETERKTTSAPWNA